MSTNDYPVGRLTRHTTRILAVTRSMTTIRAALPLIRAILLASVATALIMVGLPAVLAVAATGAH